MHGFRSVGLTAVKPDLLRSPPVTSTVWACASPGCYGCEQMDILPAPTARAKQGYPVVQLLSSGLVIGGKERAALRLAERGIAEGGQQELWLFDTPFRSPEFDFDPGAVPSASCRAVRGWIELHPRSGPRARCRLGHPRRPRPQRHRALLRGARLRPPRGGQRAPRLVGTFHTWPGHETRTARLLTRWAGSRSVAVAAVSDELKQRLLAPRLAAV